jgi:dTDP-4-dehydrorhamnose reductase
MRILVLGAGGMAGHVVALHLRERGFKIDTQSAKNALDDNTELVDITDLEAFKKLLNNKTYDVIINCIALLTKECEERKDLAVYLNSYIPRFLEHKYLGTKTKIIQISSDFVFSGENPPYSENGIPDNRSTYGLTKALGEINNDKDLTLRLSIVGPSLQKDGGGLFDWFYSQKGEISGFTNAMWSGITTTELAKGIEAAIKQNITGIYHFAPPETISKFELLELFKNVFGCKNISISAVVGSSAGTTISNTRTDFDYKIPDYITMVQYMKKWVETHPKLYKHYEI